MNVDNSKPANRNDAVADSDPVGSAVPGGEVERHASDDTELAAMAVDACEELAELGGGVS